MLEEHFGKEFPMVINANKVKMKACLLLLTCPSLATAFSPLPNSSARSAPSVVQMVGGKGWENNSFLDSLGGSDEDQEAEKDNYQDFSDARKAFLERSRERLDTEAGRKFMADYQRSQENRQVRDAKERDALDDIMGRVSGDPDGDLSSTSSGGTRMQAMMQRSAMRGMGSQGGYEQKLIVPIDDDESEVGEDR